MRQKHGWLLRQQTDCVLCLPVIAEIRTALNLAWPLISQSRTSSAKQFTVASVARCSFACLRIGRLASLWNTKEASEDVRGFVGWFVGLFVLDASVTAFSFLSLLLHFGELTSSRNPLPLSSLFNPEDGDEMFPRNV